MSKQRNEGKLNQVNKQTCKQEIDQSYKQTNETTNAHSHKRINM